MGLIARGNAALRRDSQKSEVGPQPRGPVTLPVAALFASLVTERDITPNYAEIAAREEAVTLTRRADAYRMGQGTQQDSAEAARMAKDWLAGHPEAR